MIKFRDDLSAPGLLRILKNYFAGITDPRQGHGNTEISIANALMSAMAMFILKCQSLLQFDQARQDPAIVHNLRHLFSVSTIPSDTQMRDIIDKVNPNELLKGFSLLLAKAQRGKVLEQYEFLEEGYILSVDGTGYFSSNKVSCESCCEKVHRDGIKSYYHNFVPAVLVSPEKAQVLVVSAEPVRGRIEKVNDCEQAASERLLRRIRTDHPKLKLVVVQDGLHSNNPHVELLRNLNMHFILGVKEKGHASLFETMAMHVRIDDYSWLDVAEERLLHRFRFKNDLYLNNECKEKVNFLEYWYLEDGVMMKTWTWVTDIKITRENAMKLMKAGRARWKIENETFNTLKNQGYEFEHNFGHGYRHLSTNFALLMLLAFAVDQLQEMCCAVFQRAKEIHKSRKNLWQAMRGLFSFFLFQDWESFFHALILKKPQLYDTS